MAIEDLIRYVFLSDKAWKNMSIATKIGTTGLSAKPLIREFSTLHRASYTQTVAYASLFILLSSLYSNIRTTELLHTLLLI